MIKINYKDLNQGFCEENRGTGKKGYIQENTNKKKVNN